MPLHKILFTATLLISLQLQAQHWEITEKAPMPERVSNSAVAAGNVNGTDYVYSFAGIDSTKLQSGIHLKSFRYHVQADTWESIPPLPDNMGKIAASADRVGNVIYIIGGYHVFPNLSEVSSNKVHRYDMLTNTYLSDGAPIPVPIDDQVQAVWRDSLIYVITGWSNNGNVPNVQIYNPANDTWLVGTPTPNTHNYKSFGSSGVIHNDTIYYFGGARSSGNFGIQNDFRKGIINADNPTEINWSIGILANDVVGYRMAATISQNKLYWIGGSGNTYNFNGIAYNNNTGVPPLNRSLVYYPESGAFQTDELNELPMDLRGLGVVDETTKFIVGGMMANQEVSNKTLRLNPIILTIDTKELETQPAVVIHPNPVSEKLYLKMEQMLWKTPDYEIINALGQVVLRGTYRPEGIHVRSLPSGLYWLSATGNAHSTSKPFLKL
jgi:Secretion system C-terminal sorting domain/Kelch motif